ncbi:hypothetical protein [Dysgonomonas sp. HGC4]|uniref:hypothetical protein n=1 Tax=Dysgonomonas sp. HGC4 TaxID=1658009 RepID=UPI0006820F4A|nr:hypothetical protein [Dysgonomonas sp. HGC4]MBD8347839.1 hypothetical protein [Dysgonomonas sp. HGC4]
MEIVELEGEDQRLYYLVAHLIMDENILNYNLNYPYRTSSEYKWFIATNRGVTLGFIPVKLKEGKATINNYYIADDDSKVFSALLERIIKALYLDFRIESVTQIKHISYFEHSGFSTVLFWKRYAKMKVFNNEEKCL